MKLEQTILLLSLWTLGALALQLQTSSPPSFSGYEIFQKLHQEPPPPEIAQGTGDNVGEYWVEQKLDQFDRKNNRTWFMVIFIVSVVTVFFLVIFSYHQYL